MILNNIYKDAFFPKKVTFSGCGWAHLLGPVIPVKEKGIGWGRRLRGTLDTWFCNL